MKRTIDYGGSSYSGGVPVWGITSFSIGSIAILLNLIALLRWH